MLMRIYLIMAGLLCPYISWAHHSNDHQVLQVDPQQVINATRQGSTMPWLWVLWIAIIFLLVIGIVRQWKRK